jgi:hypothetical protein
MCSKFGKIVLVAMVNELHRTGGEELTFEKVCLLFCHHFSTDTPTSFYFIFGDKPTYVDWDFWQ